MIYQKKFTLLQNWQFILFFWHSVYKMYCAECTTREHEPFQMHVCQNWFKRRIWNLKGLMGICLSPPSFNKGTMLSSNRHSLDISDCFLLSMSNLYCLKGEVLSSGLTCVLASTERLVISTQHHYSAQLDFDMHSVQNMFLFSHCNAENIVMLLMVFKWKKGSHALEHEASVVSNENLVNNENISLIPTQIPIVLLGHTV